MKTFSSNPYRHQYIFIPNGILTTKHEIPLTKVEFWMFYKDPIIDDVGILLIDRNSNSLE